MYDRVRFLKKKKKKNNLDRELNRVSTIFIEKRESDLRYKA